MAHNNLESLLQEAYQLHQNEQFFDAKGIYLKVLSIDSSHPLALTLLGTLYLQMHHYEEAINSLQKAIAQKTYNPLMYLVHQNLGVALVKLKIYQKALVHFDTSIHLNPNYHHTYNEKGYLFYELKRFDEALQSYDKAIEINPLYAEALSNRGLTLHEVRRFDEALQSYDKAIEINPLYAEALSNRGLTLHEVRRFDEALQSYDKAIEINPLYAEALSNRGLTLHEVRRFDEALQSYDKAIEINPLYAEALSNRGLTLHEVRRFDEALQSYDKAIEINPLYAEALSNRGLTLHEVRRFDEALQSYDKAIEISNNTYLDVHWNKAIALLSLGNFKEGWPLYEYRWQGSSLKNSQKKLENFLWLGKESIKNKTIYIYHEQGFGDAIQFCRYMPMLEKLGANIIAKFPQELITILKSLRCMITFIKDKDSTPKFDYQTPIMSLPLAFKTELETIPSEVPYLFSNLEKISFWKKILGKKIKPRIGLVWSGNINHENDAQRSIALKKFLPLLNLPYDFFCLQKDIRDEDKVTLNNQKNLKDYSKEFYDFSDTAGLINCMDLVISVDSSIAHLAGAMNKEVWILLPRYNLDYRWMLDKKDSPWYPSACLIRQDDAADWSKVIDNTITKIKIKFEGQAK